MGGIPVMRHHLFPEVRCARGKITVLKGHRGDNGLHLRWQLGKIAAAGLGITRRQTIDKGLLVRLINLLCLCRCDIQRLRGQLRYCRLPSQAKVGT